MNYALAQMSPPRDPAESSATLRIIYTLSTIPWYVCQKPFMPEVCLGATKLLKIIVSVVNEITGSGSDFE